MSGGTLPVSPVLNEGTVTWLTRLRIQQHSAQMRCRRCGRTLRSERAIECGYGERCRRFVYRAARALRATDNQVASRAADALIAPSLTPTGRKNVWRSKSSDGKREYITAPNTCTCPSNRYRLTATVCYHSAAASVLAAPMARQ